MNQEKQKQIIKTYFTGVLMGAADIVPGVSGGTVAFIMGIYNTLIDSIKVLSSDTLQLALKFKIKEALQSIPFLFLVPLALGIFSSILTMSELLETALRDYPVYIWSLFFGFVLSAIFVVGKRIKKWEPIFILVTFIAALFAFLLVGIVPTQTPNNLLLMFGAGAIAICAMILPGVSGSFLLIIMGKYEQLLMAVNDRDIAMLLAFMLGAALGISLFARLLSYLFKNYHDLVIAALTGFMIGSLRKLWPYKETISTRINSKGYEVPVLEQNILPEFFSNEFYLSVALVVLGIAIILYLESLGLTKEEELAESNSFFGKIKKLFKK
jgi:putative membrane protein